MKGRKNNKKIIIVLLLLIVGEVIGYAALRINLTINGQTTVAKNTWSVKFTTITPVKNDGTITSTPTVTGDTTFSFGVKLNTPGDEYKVKVKVENQGTIDAMLSANPTLSGLSDMDAYLDYSVTYADGVAVEAGNLLAAGSEDEIIVTLKFKNDISAADLADLATADVTKTMTFSMTYAQSDNTASERKKVITYISRQNEGQITIGDVIRIGETEEFYVISSDSEKTVLQGKYNLLVGHEIKNYRDIGLVSTDIPRYGLQDAAATIGTDGNYKYVAPFSDDVYWMSGSDLLSPYSENDTIYYDSSNGIFKYRQDDSVAYPYIYDENSVVYQYISGENGYVDKLKDMGAPSSITGRIITYEEAMNIRNIDHNILYYHKASYWIANPYGLGGVYYIAPTLGDIDHASYRNINGYGIRPVIEIPTSEL